jgi:hypothetical protein
MSLYRKNLIEFLGLMRLISSKEDMKRINFIRSFLSSKRESIKPQILE